RPLLSERAKHWPASDAVPTAHKTVAAHAFAPPLHKQNAANRRDLSLAHSFSASQKTIRTVALYLSRHHPAVDPSPNVARKSTNYFDCNRSLQDTDHGQQQYMLRIGSTRAVGTKNRLLRIR